MGLAGIRREDERMWLRATHRLGDATKGQGPEWLRCSLPSGPGLAEALSYLLRTTLRFLVASLTCFWIQPGFQDQTFSSTAQLPAFVLWFSKQYGGPGGTRTKGRSTEVIHKTTGPNPRHSALSDMQQAHKICAHLFASLLLTTCLVVGVGHAVVNFSLEITFSRSSGEWETDKENMDKYLKMQSF